MAAAEGALRGAERFHVRRALRAQRVIDPACHMGLDADSVTIRVRWCGMDLLGDGRDGWDVGGSLLGQGGKDGS
jgi:hypothetical protein